MSINSAMLAGVSGLVANSSALAAISDNIANVNTVAYKRNQVNFANVVTAQAVTGRYSAGGVQGVSRQFVSQQGLIQSATSSTDLAISGDGFFVVANKGAGLTPADQRVFTRSGSFGIDADGFLVNDAKLYLQGWPANATGGFTTSPSDLASMDSINVKNLGAAVKATTSAFVSANLNAATTPPTTAWTAGNMAAYANQTPTPATALKPDFTMDISVIDSQGGSHKLVMAFRRAQATGGPPAVAPANQWNAEIYASPASDVVGVGGNTNGMLASGIVNFNQDGSLNLATTTLFGAPGAAAQLALAASATPANPGPAWASAAGVAAQTIDLDLTKLTQYASASTVNAIGGNGATVGNVVGVDVSEDGIVSAIFDNSEIRQIAKIGLATFPNADGLRPVSGNAYRGTMASGDFVLKEAGNGGAGTISPSTLEASTVDLSAEFTGLITTQKAYSASSKIITTADQMLEELLNIKR